MPAAPENRWPDENTTDHIALDITTVHADGITTLTVAGEVDLANADQLSHAGFAAVQVLTRGLVVDLRAVTFMDSTGMGHLNRVLAAARPAPARVLVSHPRLVTLFRVLGMANTCELQHVPAAQPEIGA